MKKIFLILSILIINNVLECNSFSENKKKKILKEELEDHGTYGAAFPSAGKKY